MKKSILFTISILICNGLIGQNILNGKAINVYDGDTFTLLQSNGTKTKIRIIGIDAPEAKQDFGIVSRDYARSILDGKNVRVYLEPGETYGRKLGVVVTEDGLHFNYEMVANGYAWWYDYFSNDKYLQAAFESAKSQKIGLWSTNNPIPPWDWRKENKLK